jgi:hypothetical protein
MANDTAVGDEGTCRLIESHSSGAGTPNESQGGLLALRGELHFSATTSGQVDGNYRRGTILRPQQRTCSN